MSSTSRRVRIVPVRMSDAEYADARACADALGISLSRLMRSRAEALPPMHSTTDLRTANELARIGSNLNQLVHLLHGRYGVRSLEITHVLTELRSELADIRWRLRS